MRDYLYFLPPTENQYPEKDGKVLCSSQEVQNLRDPGVTDVDYSVEWSMVHLRTSFGKKDFGQSIVRRNVKVSKTDYVLRS